MNLLRAHGSPTNYLYMQRGEAACRCPWCRAGNSDYLRRWRQEHPGYWDKYKRRYYYLRRRTAEQRKRENLQQRERRRRDPEKYRRYEREYFATHPERQAAIREYHAKRRVTSDDHFKRQDVLDQMERQKGRCFWCKKKIKDGYHVDHVTPLSIETNNRPENIVIACPFCNLSKKDKHPMDWAGVMF